MSKRFDQLLTPEEAVKLIRKNVTIPRNTEWVDVERAFGRLAFSQVIAETESPIFPRSAMDGFAVKSTDLMGATDDNPRILRIAGEVVMGEIPPETPGTGICFRIPTGGSVPENFDTVVPVEDVEVSGGKVTIAGEFKKGLNIDAPGSDYRKGQILLQAGKIVRSNDIASLASTGVSKIEVLRKPRVGVAPTGNELISHGSERVAGKIYDSNGPAIIAAFNETGVFDAVHYGISEDEHEKIRSVVLKMLAENDIVVTTGGTSAGDHDLVYRILEEMEPGIIFHGLSSKPGMPTLFAVAGEKPVIGLPGPSVSAMMVLYDLFLPVLIEKAGVIGHRLSIQATLDADTRITVGRRNLIPVSLSYGKNNLAHPIQGGSGAVARLSEAQGYFVCEGDVDTLKSGTEVSVFLFSVMPI